MNNSFSSYEILEACYLNVSFQGSRGEGLNEIAAIILLVNQSGGLVVTAVFEGTGD
jgi:hypothetical protein